MTSRMILILVALMIIIVQPITRKDSLVFKGSDKYENIKEIKNVKKYSVKVGKEIGYEYYDGYAKTISSIIIVENYVYMVDEYFRKLIKVNLNTGKIISSQKVKMIGENNSFNDLIYFHGNIYVRIYPDAVYVYDKSLLLKNRLFFTENYTSDNYIKISKDTLDFRSFLINGVYSVKIDTNQKMKTDSLQLNYEDAQTEYDRCKTTIHGKNYKQIEENGKNYLITDYGWFELKNELPVSYDAYVFDFVENKVVYFDVNSKEFILYILEY